MNKFSEFLNKHPRIDGYMGENNYDPGENSPNDIKVKFKKLGTSYLRSIAKRTGFKEFKVSFNSGGNGVSGDLHLMGMFDDRNGIHLFFNKDGYCDFVTARKISSMKDYTGEKNNNLPFSVLEDEGRLIHFLQNL